MNATNSAVLTGVVVTTGRYSQGKKITMRVVVGATFLAIVLAVMPTELADKFGLLVLVAAVLNYGASIAKKTGLAK